MKKFIVTTTINKPTEATKLYAEKKDWVLIVVGDKKTPHELYEEIDCVYVHPDEQDKMDKELSDLIGWNCIQRRNFGFLKAHELGADIVATVDDDNHPYNNWGKDVYIGKKVKSLMVESNKICVDPITIAARTIGGSSLWHRGYPLPLVKEKIIDINFKYDIEIVPDIQANFWNGDPDLDAICIMMHPKESHDFKFVDSLFPFFINDSFAPFNSQNTIVSKKVLPYFFMFPHVGRMDDIWNSYYIVSKGFKVLYDKPTVNQIRVNHNLKVDAQKELVGYESNLVILNDLNKHGPNFLENYVPEETWKAFQRYQDHFKEK